MRILIYGLNFAPELTGIGKYSGEMAAFLAARGHAVRVISSPPYYPQWRVRPGYSARAYRKETWQGVEVFRCPLWVPARKSGPGTISGLERILHLSSFALSSLPLALAQRRWRPERVIVLEPSLLNAPAAALLARWSGGKAWLHIQDFELDAAQKLDILPRAGSLLRLGLQAESALYRGFDALSTISRRMLALLQQKGADPRRCFLFPNWVDTRAIFPLEGANPLRDELGIPPGAQVALYAGSISQKQGLEVLVEAARLLFEQSQTGPLFLLCGEGPSRPYLEHLAAGLPNLRFLPLQPPQRLNELLNLATVHILPQLASAADLVMPSKLGGMLASGRPVIAMAHPGTELADVVGPLGRVVPPQQASTLAKAVLEMTGQPAGGDGQGRRARAYVEENWAKERVLESFLHNLESL